MNLNAKISEGLKLISILSPQTVANTPVYSTAIDMSKFDRVYAVFGLGNMAAETIDCSLEQDSAVGFGSPSALVAATQLAAHATNNDNKQIILEAKAEDLAAGETHVRAKVVTGGATGGPVSVMILARPRYSNESALTSIAETKSA